jgi:hypothetical protein
MVSTHPATCLLTHLYRLLLMHIMQKMAKTVFELIKIFIQVSCFMKLSLSGTLERCEGALLNFFLWKGTFELIYTKRCLQNIGSWTSPNHVFYLLDDRGVRVSPPGDCAILEARWLHFLRFLKQIRKRISQTFLTIRYFCQGNPLKWKGTFVPLAPPPQFWRPWSLCNTM